ncbi:glycosyltransferase [Salegentibacter mishustinae]|uniref:glycosyltransferase n=1 Tax=Salegentibacter mishustinae TaxID=270918 RepID=UPI002492E2B3|nr:glycosyltransferase [Salegentibacter mishustinae]
MVKKVFAVVVTYNRPVLLENCIQAILVSSTYKISHLYIVVNDKNNATLEIIQKFSKLYPGLVSFKTFDNVGPAGGFFFGLEKFLESSSDYVWLMDDDIIPEPDCLQNLIACTEKNSYVFSKVLKNSGGEVRAFGWWGILISRTIVQRVGLPIKDFFYWKEDTEYLQNRMIRKFQIIPYRCKTAVVKHLHNREGKRPNWYYYYTIRNTLYYRMKIFPLNKKGVIILLKVFIGTFYNILLKEPQKLDKIKFVFLGVVHGMAGKLGKLERLH